MKMIQKTISFKDSSLDVCLTVSEADVLAGMKRTRLKYEGLSLEGEDSDRRLLRLYTFPDLIAATVAAEGIPWPLDFEDYLNLPDALGALWEKAVYALNPHWLPASKEEDESESKKVPPSIDD